MIRTQQEFISRGPSLLRTQEGRKEVTAYLRTLLERCRAGQKEAACPEAFGLLRMLVEGTVFYSEPGTQGLQEGVRQAGLQFLYQEHLLVFQAYARLRHTTPAHRALWIPARFLYETPLEPLVYLRWALVLLGTLFRLDTYEETGVFHRADLALLACRAAFRYALGPAAAEVGKNIAEAREAWETAFEEGRGQAPGIAEKLEAWLKEIKGTPLETEEDRARRLVLRLAGKIPAKKDPAEDFLLQKEVDTLWHTWPEQDRRRFSRLLENLASAGLGFLPEQGQGFKELPEE